MIPIEFNVWFVLILAAYVIWWKIDFFTTYLNLKAFRTEVPPELASAVDEEKVERTRDYYLAGAVLDLWRSIFGLIVFFVFWWLGGFGWLDAWVRGFELGMLLSGLVYIGILFLGMQLIMLPFDLVDTFGIEGRFGFNRTTPALYVLDFVKQLALSALLGMPLLLLVLWLFSTVPLAWLWAWVLTSAYMLFIAYFAPAWLLPLFNRFEPLGDGELRDRIHEMARQCDFPLGEISVMDGSLRSTKANAFFTGFGANKRIVLFDTLIEKHTVPELVAVLAHEIGHFKKNHLRQRIAMSIVGTGVVFFFLGLVLKSRSLFDAFGVEEMSLYAGFVLFYLLYRPVGDLLSVAGNWLSRKNEYEADAFAREVTGGAEPLVDALGKLSVDNLSHLSPHPAYVFLNYSHPPVVERIRALRGGGQRMAPGV